MSDDEQEQQPHMQIAGFTFSDSARTLYKEIGGTPNLDMNYTVFGQVIEGLNIIDMKNRSRDDIAYNVIDLDSEPSTKSIEAIKGEENIINVRQING